MSTKTFFPIPSPFGTGIDEQATISAFKEFLGENGHNRLEMLAHMCHNSYPMFKYPSGVYTRLETFRIKAIRNGFTHGEVDGFLTFGG